jgi:hypothetical protein
MEPQRTQFQTKPVVSNKIARLPIHKAVEFKFPPIVNPQTKEKYNQRTVSLINQKDFRKLFRGFRKEDLFIGSLKLL